VTAVGTYTLTVENANGCTETATAEVTANTNVPDLSANGGTISCATTSVQLMSNSTVAGVTYAWTGPNGFTSTDEDPMVTAVGMYNLVITAANGCTSTASVMVTGDFAAPNASAQGATLDCNSSQVLLMGNSTTGSVTFSWLGPNGFTSNLQNPQVSDIGTYTLTVMAQNGCTSTATAEVLADDDLPQISGTGGTIDCNNSSVQLMGSSTTANVTISWTGPNGFTSNDMNPTVTEPGTYVLTVAASNGCSITQNVAVVDDTTEPQVALSFGDVDCDAGSIEIIADVDVTDLDVTWSPQKYHHLSLIPEHILWRRSLLMDVIVHIPLH